MIAIRGFVFLAVLGACVGESELGTVEQQLGCLDNWELCCTSCGANGLRQAAYDNVFSHLDHNGAGAVWDAAVDGPKSFCLPGTDTGSSCQMRYAWRDWRNAHPLRDEMMTALVKFAVPKNYWICEPPDTPNTCNYRGVFGLAAEARTQSWNWVTQDYISAGLIAILHAPDPSHPFANVAICIDSDRTPSACSQAPMALIWESTQFGTALRGNPRFMAIMGGSGARNPNVNLRYGTVHGSSATVYQYNSGRCAEVGTGNGMYPSYCDSDGYGRWNHPVQVYVPADPATWYYDTGSTAPKIFQAPTFPQVKY